MLKNRNRWTEDELDGALLSLSHELSPDEATMRRLRGASFDAVADLDDHAPVLLDAQHLAPRHPSRRLTSRRQLIKAAAVLTAAAAVLAVGVVPFGPSGTPANAQAAGILRLAAAAVTPDPQPGPGQYRRISTHAWYMNSVLNASPATAKPGMSNLYATVSWLRESVDTIWVPARYEDSWLMRRQPTGNIRWLHPTSAPNPLPPMYGDATFERSAPCGGFVDDLGCAAVGGWETPTRAWAAALPRDPAALYARLKHDAPQNSRGDAELVAIAADALRSGLLPADLRAALYKALALAPGMRVTQDQVTLDGRRGTALGVDDGSTIQEIVIDPTTGEFIGEREVYSTSQGELPAGTVVQSTSVDVQISSTRG